jgi:hypothetical protein
MIRRRHGARHNAGHDSTGAALLDPAVGGRGSASRGKQGRGRAAALGDKRAMAAAPGMVRLDEAFAPLYASLLQTIILVGAELFRNG